MSNQNTVLLKSNVSKLFEWKLANLGRLLETATLKKCEYMFHNLHKYFEETEITGEPEILQGVKIFDC